MPAYEMIVTAVSARADLFARMLRSALECLDQAPVRVLVHEDVQPTGPQPNGLRPDGIGAALAETRVRGRPLTFAHQVQDPARGRGPALAWLLGEVREPFVLCMTEDFDFLRRVPVRRALQLMQRFDATGTDGAGGADGVHAITFNKRATQAAKHPGEPDEWRKVERDFAGQVLTLSQALYSQAALWRVVRVRPYFERLVREDREPWAWATRKVNRWMNADAGDEAGNDYAVRRRLGTYYWGPVGEPAFVAHTGADRRAERPREHTC